MHSFAPICRSLSFLSLISCSLSGSPLLRGFSWRSPGFRLCGIPGYAFHCPYSILCRNHARPGFNSMRDISSASLLLCFSASLPSVLLTNLMPYPFYSSTCIAVACSQVRSYVDPSFSFPPCSIRIHPLPPLRSLALTTSYILYGSHLQTLTR